MTKADLVRMFPQLNPQQIVNEGMRRNVPVTLNDVYRTRSKDKKLGAVKAEPATKRTPKPPFSSIKAVAIAKPAAKSARKKRMARKAVTQTVEKSVDISGIAKLVLELFKELVLIEVLSKG